MDDSDQQNNPEPNVFEYVVERLHNVPHLIDDCCNLINAEWKRSHSARLRSIEGSSENFPMSLILLKISKKIEVVGHCKISKLFMSQNKVFVETVIIHPSLRGKGLGKLLMNEAEKICKSKNTKYIYLTTKGQELFYEKLGYKKCSPVTIYGSQNNDSDESTNEPEEPIMPVLKPIFGKTTDLVPPPAPPMPKNSLNSSLTVVPFTFMRKNIIY